MKDLFTFLGCGNGLLKTVHPQTRIVAGVLIGSACLLVPLQSKGQANFMIIIAICWVLFAAMPGKMLSRCAIASIILFFPFLLLSPWMTVDSYSGSGAAGCFTQAGGIALRSTCMLFIGASTIASLTLHDVHRGLVCLPIPRSIAALIVQIINQTMLLAEETARIIDVLRLRGTSGVRGIRVLFAFPVVWMVRMLFRAERIAAAIAVRGYGFKGAAKGDRVKLTIADMSMLFAASLIFVISLTIRVKSFL